MGGLFWRLALRGLRGGPRDPGRSLLVRPSSGGPSWTRERTLVAVKPDGVQRRLVGDVIQRFERRGFTLVGMKMLQAPESVLAEHYQDLQRKPFYPALIRYMSSGPMVAMVWEGYNVVRASRAMIGHTDSAEAAPGTIRGDFSVHISRNVIHASDSVEGAQREIQLWFQSSELDPLPRSARTQAHIPTRLPHPSPEEFEPPTSVPFCTPSQHKIGPILFAPKCQATFFEGVFTS
ncbi:nucleoside diphosphate kinase, mitochondrial isoform X1 [Saimiri boliviensis]|uniref:nucleoside diphosphate kinase, mitochondrial isoform X1 n=1 Tax=Saimiri boliviensis TaxID=27679 RepID=UPI00193CDBC6|nr:nucleoside diphosphate kinase, mitochondrial isoform X1 [Saimiri boliviensis boliviensis]